MKIVRVVWLDAMAIAEWTKTGAEIEPQRCTTVGHLISEADDHVTVAATISGDEFNAAQQIPTSMIEAMTVIVEAAS